MAKNEIRNRLKVLNKILLEGSLDPISDIIESLNFKQVNKDLYTYKLNNTNIIHTFVFKHNKWYSYFTVNYTNIGIDYIEVKHLISIEYIEEIESWSKKKLM